MKQITLNRKKPVISVPLLLSAYFGMLAFLPVSVFAAPVFAADPINGQKIYLMHCAGCHGQNGISDMPQAPNLARYEIFTKADQALIDTIRSGRNMMPAFLGILNDHEIRDVISYVRTLH